MTTERMRSRMTASFPGGERLASNIEINEMPMIVTLDQLKPSDVLPRMRKNDRYEDIKMSIRAKGLDQPPPITRRPGDDIYTISNGGNTRLEILNDLYRETKDEKYYRINCLFRPWGGELKSIIGHLAENDLRSDFTFIEKSIGVAKSKKLYEEELKQTLSLRELSNRLNADGFPISHVLLSKMLNTIEYLYPYIPEILKSGLSRNNVEKILQLRTICEQRWNNEDQSKLRDKNFDAEFNMVLMPFDLEPDIYSYERLQDEAFGHFSTIFGINYNDLEFDLQQKRSSKSKLAEVKKDSKNTSVSVEQTESELNKPLVDNKTGDILICENLAPSDAVEQAIENMDLTEMNPWAYSITTNLKTNPYDEIRPVLDIWKIKNTHNNYQVLSAHINDLLIDIFNELNIDGSSLDLNLSHDDNIKNRFAFFEIHPNDSADPLRSGMFQFLKSIFIDGAVDISIKNEWFVGKKPLLNDYTILKIFRLIRLKRVYDELIEKMVFTKQL